MTVILKRFGQDISSSIEMKSLVVTTALTNEVGQLKFRIKSTPSKALATLGAVIDLYEDSNHIFGGTITEKNSVVEGGILLGYDYTVSDHSFGLNSKLVVQLYENQDPQSIVNDIVATFTDGTYGTTGVVLGGFNVQSIKFNYEPVTTSIEKLAGQIGWEWYVDPDKDIQFFPPNTVVDAPYEINDTAGNLEWATLDIEQSIINLKNSIYVIGGTYTKVFTALTTADVYLTDGSKSIFTLAYPYTPDTIAVTLDGAAQTIGTDQVTPDASVQVQYNEANRIIRFTSVPTTGKTVKIYGSAQIPIAAQIDDNGSISTYGQRQDVIFDEQIKSVAEAQDRGRSQIAKYGSPVYAIKFSTLRTGFRIGQTVRVNSTLFGDNVQVVIKKIRGRMYSPTQLRYDIECVGTEKVNFIDIMKVLMTRANASTVVSDNLVLQVLKSISESMTISDTLSTPTTTSGPYKWSPGSNDGLWNKFTWS
jgi:hypothetical protein